MKLDNKKKSKNVVKVDYTNEKLRSMPEYKDKDGNHQKLTKDLAIKDTSKFDKSEPNKKPKSVVKVSVIEYKPASDKGNRFSNDIDASSEKYIRSMYKLEKKMKKKG